MRIVINAISLLSPLTGVGNYTLQIASNLPLLNRRNEYFYFFGYYTSQITPVSEKTNELSRVKSIIQKTPFMKQILRSLNNLMAILLSNNFDIYFEPNFIPLRIPAKYTVVTIHDFSFALYPNWHDKEKIKYFRNNFWKKIKRADQIITVSEYIRNEAISQFGFASDKIKVIYNGLDQNIFHPYSKSELDLFRKIYNLPPEFILFVGSIEPRKNLLNLLKAYSILKKSIRNNYKLVLAGFKGWKNEKEFHLINKLKDDIKYIGFVTTKDLAKVYNLATLFVYPSFYEGFGLPPLEAMACACPVITSKTSSMPEICGESAYYIDPHEPEEIAFAMEKILEDQDIRKNLISAGLKRASNFSWVKSAAEHLALFEKIYKEHKKI